MTNYQMEPGPMDLAERTALADTLPLYLTREQAAELAVVHIKSVDRWRRVWDETDGAAGVRTYWERVTLNEHPPGEVRISKVQLLERLGMPMQSPARSIADASRAMFGE